MVMVKKPPTTVMPPLIHVHAQCPFGANKSEEMEPGVEGRTWGRQLRSHSGRSSEALGAGASTLGAEQQCPGERGTEDPTCAEQQCRPGWDWLQGRLGARGLLRTGHTPGSGVPGRGGPNSAAGPGPEGLKTWGGGRKRRFLSFLKIQVTNSQACKRQIALHGTQRTSSPPHRLLSGQSTVRI